MFDTARAAARRIVDMVREDLKPRDILKRGAFRNAVAAVLAVSGSINCIKHLQATATEAGVKVDVFRLFNELGRKVPVLSAVRPNGDDSIENFEAAGGARALLKQLEPLLDTKALTVTGRTVAQNLKDVTVMNERVIRPLDEPFSDKPPIVILKGTLAPDSAIVKLGLRDAGRKSAFTGKAIVFDDGQSAMQAIAKGKVKPGHVLVVRGMGPKGGPGMAGPASMVVFALDAAGLQNEVAFVSDGQLSGLCNKGLTIAEVSPESVVGGPISLVRNGDVIVIDVDKHVLDLKVGRKELAARRKKRGEPKLPKAKGYLSIYQRSVQPMAKGAVLVKSD
jgi:dihydroxy-acid dehydratase